MSKLARLFTTFFEVEKEAFWFNSFDLRASILFRNA